MQQPWNYDWPPDNELSDEAAIESTVREFRRELESACAYGESLRPV